MSLSVLTPTGWEAVGGGVAEWTRPDDWLATSVTAGQQKIQCLVAVGADATVEANRVMTLVCQGAYTVDWGDGTAPQNVGSATSCNHLYNPTALAGTATSEGWLQALITITPQAGNLTRLDFLTAYYASKTWRSPVVEVVIGSSALTTLSFGGICPLLQRVEFKQPFSPTSITGTFATCPLLHEVAGEIATSLTNLSSLFSGCPLLTNFPTLTFTASSGINATSMFSGCSSMVEPPTFTTSAVTLWVSTFTNCYALQRLWSGFAISANTTAINGMFSGCLNLEAVPLLHTDACTTINGTFTGCTRLRTVSFTSTALVTQAGNCFSGCSVLESVTGLDLSGPTSSAGFNSFVFGCFRLCELEFLAGKGPRFSWTVVGMLDAAQLNAIYTALPTVTAQTITVSSVTGTLADDPTIATAKGWTVTGS